MTTLPLRDLQKIILGTRTDPLSAIEIRNLFSYPTTPESVLYIITALNKDRIDPSTTLIQSIANATKKQDLVSVGLALRYGASPNLYVDAPNIGDIHILGYTYLLLHKKDIPLLNAVVIMLMATGADPNLPIFDSKGGIVKDEFSLVEPIKGQSVLEWLDDQGFSTIIHKILNQNYNKVDKDFMTLIGTFLDRNDLLKTDPRLDEVIGSHSINIFTQHEQKVDSDKGLRLSIAYLNITTFEKFIDRGATLGYGDINNIILEMKRYHEAGDIISREQLRQMLTYAIAHGTLLDIYQEELLKFDENIYNKIITAYGVPYWKKICSVEGNSPDRLKLLAYRLNLDPEDSKDIICEQIRKILQSDLTKIKQNVIDRNRLRIRSTAARINEFDNGSPPSLVCSNQSVLTTDPYNFPDHDIAFYRDQEKLWCFTSNNFVKIIEQKKNPYTLQPFPDNFIQEVKRKIETISKYRSIEDLPTPVSETLDNLSKPDIISNIYTDKYVKFFLQALALNGLTEWNIQRLTIDDMHKLLMDNFGIQVNLTDLDRKHAEITFYMMAYYELSKDPSNNKIFKQIEDLTQELSGSTDEVITKTINNKSENI